MNKDKLFLWVATIVGAMLLIFGELPFKFVGLIAFVSACGLGTLDGYELAVKHIKEKYELTPKRRRENETRRNAERG